MYIKESGLLPTETSSGTSFLCVRLRAWASLPSEYWAAVYSKPKPNSRKWKKTVLISFHIIALFNNLLGEKGRVPFDPKGLEKTRPVVAAMEKLAKAKNTNVAGIALAYAFAKVHSKCLYYNYSQMIGSLRVPHLGMPQSGALEGLH